jgi:predicted deacetylase
VGRCALNIVPNWHGSHLLSSSPSLLDLLREQAAAGSELVLHGLEHRRQGRLTGPIWSRLRAELFAGDAAEFLSLGSEDAAGAVRRGFDIFAQAELPEPSTFCAPGWLLTRQAIAALAGTGIRRIAGMFSVVDLTSERRCWLPSIGHMGASTGQEAGVQLMNLLVGHTLVRAAGAVCVYLHPQRREQGSGERRTLAAVARLVDDGWVPTTYRELCEEGDE